MIAETGRVAWICVVGLAGAFILVVAILVTLAVGLIMRWGRPAFLITLAAFAWGSFTYWLFSK